MAMKKLLTLLIAFVGLCNMVIAQVYGVPINRNDKLEIVKAADMVLDVNVFGTAHSVLVLFGMPVNDKCTEEFAKRFSKNWSEYRNYIATNAYIYWPELERSPKDMLMGRLTSYGSDGSDIKELYFSLGETYRTKFLKDLSLYGYKKIKSENKKDQHYKVNYLETTYQKENHLCVVKTYGNAFNVSFTRKVRQESAEEKVISEQCKRFIRLHAVDGVRQYDLKDNNVPYEVPAVVDIQFPSENKIVNIPTDVYKDVPERISKRLEVNITSQGNMSIDSYNSKDIAYFKWIKPYIYVKSTAKVNFSRYGKGYVIGDSFDLFIHESEEFDSCTVSFKIKYKNSDEFIVKNQKEIEEKLTSVYGNSDMLNSIWMSFPRKDMARSMYFVGYTYMVKVHVYKRKVTYSFNNISATYMLPFVYFWGEPVKK